MVDRQELSEQTANAGAGDVSERMFRHYRALFHAGYENYVPINRFDLVRSMDPFMHDTADSRYAYVEFGEPVRATILRDAPMVFFATASDISEAGVMLLVDEDQGGRSLARGANSLRVGDSLRLDLLGATRGAIDGRVVERVEELPGEARWRVVVEFFRLQSVLEFVEREPLARLPCPVRLVADDGGPVPADQLGVRVFNLLDALESSRFLLNDFIDRGAPAERRRASPAKVSRLSMDSPLEVLLDVAPHVVTIVASASALLAGGAVAYRNVQEGRLAGAQADREREVAAGQHLDNLEKYRVLRQSVVQDLERDDVNLSEPVQLSRVGEDVLKRLERNFEALAGSGVYELQVPESLTATQAEREG